MDSVFKLNFKLKNYLRYLGNPAIQVGVTCFLRFLKHQVRIICEQQEQILSHK